MTEPTRKLAAIVFTDIAGYTEQMSQDQDVAFVLLEEKQSKFRPLIKEHNGTLIKEMGDGTLSHYPTAIDASKCSIELQKSIIDNDKLNVRIGIHLGDTMFKDGDVFGDGVNIASRLESMSPAGGILVSKNVYDELLSREGFEGISLGLQSLKGVGRLIEVYGLKDAHLTVPNPNDYKNTKVDVHTDDEVPSIAIIPFDNKGADEDVFYAYGISADLISDCSGAGLIRVASLKDVEKLDYSNLETAELSEKLLVRYIAQGTLWKMGEMFQLSVELYDTKDKKVVWSDRWQEKWDNLTNIKVNLSDGLLKALDTKPEAEQKAETSNPEAYEFYLKAIHKFRKRENKDDAKIAQGLADKAIELDDNLIRAKVFLANTYTEMGDNDKAIEVLGPALEQAQRLGDKQGEAAIFSTLGTTYMNKGNLDQMIGYHEKALEIYQETGNTEKLYHNLYTIGYAHKDKGDLDKGLDYLKRSLIIAKNLDNKIAIKNTLYVIGTVYRNKGDIDTAQDFLKRGQALAVTGLTKEETGVFHLRDGIMCYEMCEYENAIEFFNNANKILEEVANIPKYLYSLYFTGITYNSIGSYDTALDYFERGLEQYEQLDDRLGIAMNLYGIGYQHHSKGDYDIAIEYLDKSCIILKEAGAGYQYLIQPTTALFLTCKNLGREFDKEEIHTIVNNSESFEFYINIRLYKLLDDRTYLETAYSQVQKIARYLEPDIAKKFLNYPIPKQIIQEWEGVS